MAATASLFNKYIWLTDLIYSAGRITRKEIDNRWAHSSLNENHESRIPERTFHRWRQEIEELFHLCIDCYKPTNTYYIANASDMRHNKTHQWLLNTFAVTNLVNESQDIQDRILLEDMPSDARFLTPIMEAMRNKRVLKVTYQRFDAAEGHSFEMQPYCVKAFKLRWYMVGLSSDHPNEIRVYALDRIHDMQLLDKTYEFPADFDAHAYFHDYYGVWTGGQKPERVVIEVSARGANYLRSLPLHHSQKEIERNYDSSVFEFFIAPTFDFVQELRTHGENLRVLQPTWLAEDFCDVAKKIYDLYSNH